MVMPAFTSGTEGPWVIMSIHGTNGPLNNDNWEDWTVARSDNFACLVLVAAVASSGAALAQQREAAADKAGMSCDEFLPAKKQVGGQSIGPDECRIVSSEVVVNLKGQKFQRLELKISGTVEGWVTKQGTRSSYFNDGPDFVFTQSRNTSQRFKGIGRYTGATGH